MNTQRCADSIVAEIASRYGAEAAQMEFLGGFRNRVYVYEQSGQQYILRISFELQRTVEMVIAEVDWLRYLAAKGMSVACVVPSREDKWVEIVEVEGRSVPIVVFEKAPGHPPGEEEWNEQLFGAMGRFLGRMHCLTREYAPNDALCRRPSWRDYMDVFAPAYLPAVDRAIQEKHRELKEYFARLPQESDAYGLVHVDFHRGNFFVHEGNLTLFDFDDCQYSWFADDLAMALFYALWPPDQSEAKCRFAQTFYRALLEGYRLENHLEARWLSEIPHFMRRREISLYMVMTALGEGQWDEEIKQFMQGRREKILNDVPYIDITYIGLVDE